MSGFSSGGFKTAFIFNQWPTKFRGVGILSGAIGDLTVDKTYRLSGSHDWNSWRQTEVNKGVFPPASDFKGKPVYLQAGTADNIVWKKETDLTANFFRALGANIKENSNKYAHIVPSIATSAPKCGSGHLATENCDGIDTIGDMWKWIMNFTPKPMHNNFDAYGKYFFVDTRPFMMSVPIVPAKEKISESAGLYVPNACLQGGCDLHVFMHGCMQAENEDFMKKVGIY